MKQRIQMTWILTIVLGLFLVFVIPAYAAPSVFNWSANAWSNPPEALSKSYSAGSPLTAFNFTFADISNRRLLNISPQTNSIITGGAGASEQTLFIGANFANTSESIILTIDLPTSHATGVSFTLMDIDTSQTNPNTLQDQVVVTGSGNSLPVIPTLSASSPTDVSVVGNTATSIGTSGIPNPIDNGSPNGNVVVTFPSAINQIVITYKAGPGSTADPDSGGIALYNISFTPSTPTAVSLQSFQAQTPDSVAPLMLASIIIAGFTVVWAVQRRRQLKKVVKPAPIRPPHTP